MTRLVLAPLLLAGALLAEVPSSPAITSVPDMPPKRLSASEAAALDVRRLSLLHYYGDFIGFVLRPEGNAYAGAYLRDPRADAYEEVGAWRGELVGPCATEAACAEGLAALASLAQAAHARRPGAPTPAPTAAPEAGVLAVSVASEDALSAPLAEPNDVAAPPAAPTVPAPVPVTAVVPPRPADSAPAPPPNPPTLTALFDLVVRLRSAHPLASVVALVGLTVVWWSLRSARRAELRERSVVITHDEHLAAVSQQEQRLLADKAKLERANAAVEAEEAKLISRIASITGRL